jgi:hypothetical protein
MFWVIVGVLLLISFIMSLASLRDLVKRHPEIKQVSDELAKGKVLFHRDSSGSS